MSALPEKIRDLITSEEKLKIYELVSSSTDTFTAKDICNQLQEQGVKVKLTTVHVLLKGLCCRRYLKQFNHKLGSTRGRSTIHFQKN